MQVPFGSTYLASLIPRGTNRGHGYERFVTWVCLDRCSGTSGKRNRRFVVLYSCSEIRLKDRTIMLARTAFLRLKEPGITRRSRTPEIDGSVHAHQRVADHPRHSFCGNLEAVDMPPELSESKGCLRSSIVTV